MSSANWPTYPLGDLAENIMVGIANAATHAYRQEGVLLLRNLNIKEGYIDESSLLYIDPDYEKQHRNKRLKAGDVVTVRTGYPGISAVVPDKFENAQCFTSLITRPKPKLINSRFLCFYINSPAGKRFITSAEAGGAQKNVNASVLAKMPIPLPPLAEQENVVEILFCWDQGISKLKEYQSQLYRLKQAFISKFIFAKAEKKSALSELCEINPRRPEEPEDGNVTFIGMADIGEDGSILKRQQRKYSEVKQGFTPFISGDTIVAKITPCFENGKGALASSLVNDIGFGSTEFHILRPHPGIDKRLIHYICQAKPFRTKGEMFMTGSAGQRRVSVDFLKEFLVLVPKEQRETCNVIQAVTDMSLNVGHQITAMQKQKQALMQQLLTGKIRVKV